MRWPKLGTEMEAEVRNSSRDRKDRKLGSDRNITGVFQGVGALKWRAFDAIAPRKNGLYIEKTRTCFSI